VKDRASDLEAARWELLEELDVHVTGMRPVERSGLDCPGIRPSAEVDFRGPFRVPFPSSWKQRLGFVSLLGYPLYDVWGAPDEAAPPETWA
jgi:hypothetical protein